MCRYAFSTYKPHYVCFECRKMFRRRLLGDIDRDLKESSEAKCPQCGGLMADMGLDFKPPRKDDVKAWQHIKDLYSVGITFHSCGCSGPGYIRKSKDKLIEHLQDKKEKYIENFRFWSHFDMPEEKAEAEKFIQKNFRDIVGRLPNGMYDDYKKRKLEKEKAIAYWTERINEIDKHINLLRTN